MLQPLYYRVISVWYIMGRNIAECLESICGEEGYLPQLGIKLPFTVESSSLVHILWFSIPP